MSHQPVTKTAPPTRYVVPTINGDPEAAFQLATAYGDLADAVALSRHRVALIFGQLAGSWQGPGHRAVDTPVTAFLHNAGLLSNALQEAATELESYGRRLAKAQQHHGFSMHRLLKVGAVVAVSATAIVVTCGAASVVEAAAATAAVGGATEAADAATAADAVAAGGLDSALDAMSVVKPLLAFVVPHLVQAEWAAGAMAVYDELTIDRLNWSSIAESGATAFVASGAAAKGSALVGESGLLPHLMEGSVWGSAAASENELFQHRLDLADVAESFVLAGASTASRDALRERGLWPLEHDYRRDALVALLHRDGHIVDPEIAHELAELRQPAKELIHGEIDLRLHEGPGHTIDRHISKSAPELLTRVRNSRTAVASTYWDEASAREAIQRTLRAHAGMIHRWVGAGCPETLRLRVTSPYDVGFAIDRQGKVTFVKQAAVVLRRDRAGIVMVTSYPLGR
jgi:hypothetical protein